MQKHGSLFEKLQSFDQIDDFLCFFTNWGCFCICLPKSSSKRKNMVVLSKSCKFWPNPWVFVLFHEMNHLFLDLAKILPPFEETTISLHFDQLLRKKLQKLPQFVKKHKKSSISPKLCNFSSKLPCLCISINFSGKSCKNCLISWKSTNTNDLAKTCNFSSKLPCFGIFTNFSAKSCKKCFISWESTRNHRFCKNYPSFWTNGHDFALWWIIDWAKTCNFFEQSTMFMRFDELFSKRSQKVPRFVKKHEKSSIWPKLATFRTNYHVLAFRWTFQEKKCKKWPVSWKSTNTHRFGQNLQLLEETTMFWHFDDYCRKKLQKGGKSGSFREKWRKIIDLA